MRGACSGGTLVEFSNFHKLNFSVIGRQNGGTSASCESAMFSDYENGEAHMFPVPSANRMNLNFEKVRETCFHGNIKFFMYK